MIEVISVPSLVSRPRYLDGKPLDARTWWTRPDLVALKALCEKAVDADKGAQALGREAKSLVWKAYDTGLPVPKAWRDLLTLKQRRSEPRYNLAYPFISNVRGEHATLLAVNSLVSRDLPDFVRADVCQEIMLALWEGTVSLDELESNRKLVGAFVARYRRENSEDRGNAISLDTPMKSGAKWYDVLPGTDGQSSLLR